MSTAVARPTAQLHHQQQQQQQQQTLMTKYRKLEKIGEGTYGKVYLALNQETGEKVALKKMVFETEDEGIPSTALREVALLKELSGHPNVVALLEVGYVKKTLLLVFPFVDNDLKRHMDTIGITPRDTKNFMWQLLSGVLFCHQRRVLHRDLKPQNILISKEGQVQLADFGLGRAFSVPINQYTHEVVTLWYRAPEILLGQADYSMPIDVWSLGCIFAEMLCLKPLFPGDSEIDQLFRIFRMLGTPTNEIWPGFQQLPHYQPMFPPYPITQLRTHYAPLEKEDVVAFDLLEQMLIYHPPQRITIKAAMKAAYFDDLEDTS